MSEVLSRGGVALLKREKASLVAATGLIFERLKETSKDISLQGTLISYKGGTWGDESIEGVGYPVLRSSNMRGKRVNVAEAAWCQIPEKQAEAFSLESGDILVTKSSGSFDLVGKAALFDDPNDGNLYLFSNFTMRLRPDRKKLIPEYLAWFLRSPQALSWRFENQQTTVGLRNLQTKEYLSQVVPIPSLEIQKQVVDYLNAVETESKESITVKLPEGLDKQRHIVERVKAIAARITKAQSLREDADLEAETLAFSIARKIFASLDTEIIELGDLVDQARNGIQTGPFGAQLGSGDFIESGYPVITIGNVQFTGLETRNKLKFISKEKAKQLTRFVAQEGDILFARMGTVGRCCVVPKEAEGWIFNYHLIRVALDRTKAEPRYIHWLIRASEDIETKLSDKIRGATREGVNSKIVASLPCRIPPLDEQRRIVEYLDSIQARLASLRELQSQTQEELDAFLPSVLDMAFKGEL